MVYSSSPGAAPVAATIVVFVTTSSSGIARSSLERLGHAVVDAEQDHLVDLGPTVLELEARHAGIDLARNALERVVGGADIDGVPLARLQVVRVQTVQRGFELRIPEGGFEVAGLGQPVHARHADLDVGADLVGGQSPAAAAASGRNVSVANALVAAVISSGVADSKSMSGSGAVSSARLAWQYSLAPGASASSSPHAAGDRRDRQAGGGEPHDSSTLLHWFISLVRCGANAPRRPRDDE